MKKALILGCTGQDGSYLAELLKVKGYEVHGMIRRASLPNTARIDHIFSPEDKTYLHYGDLSDGSYDLLHNIRPDEVYNLAAMSHVRISFEVPVYTAEVNAIGPLRVLDAIRRLGLKDTRYYQASSSEMFGTTPPPQSETSPFNPVSPYGVSKLFAYHATRAYRTGYNLFAANGILFNHESPRRGVNFVTRKITRGACRVSLGLQDTLHLGNLDAVRDWGHSRDYMRAVHAILQHDVPDDFVVSTGEAHSVREFAELVFGILKLDWKKHVIEDDAFRRPNEVPALIGDATKIKQILGWKPEVSFLTLVSEMVEHDMKEARGELQRDQR